MGSGALKIGQAGEFDYSGSQALKALREEGIETVLVNPNIATIQTSKKLADKIYFLPVNPYFVKKIIKKEKPDGVLLFFGGQTALNCGVELYNQNVFEEYDVKILGTSIETVIKTEDRTVFSEEMKKMGVPMAKNTIVKKGEDVLSAAEDVGYPINIRSSYSLGGKDSGIYYNQEEVRSLLLEKNFTDEESLVIEKSLEGWKEIEFEVVRDREGNCSIICDMENFDPVGVHTGESIVVAPSQTLKKEDLEKMRSVSAEIVNHLEIIGECNIQFALNPENGDYRVIELNARLSRSSALASKATGYPLAFIAAKLAIGYNLSELKNDTTGRTLENFEPLLDYVFCKVPRWDFEKFSKASRKVGTGMKSVGEVMAIAESFEEAIQKGLRMTEKKPGFITNEKFADSEIEKGLKTPGENRVFFIESALKSEYSVERIHQLTKIDKFFIKKLKKIVEISERLKTKKNKELTDEDLFVAKKNGFSDLQIARLVDKEEVFIRDLRKRRNILPTIKKIKATTSGYEKKVNYFYLTYTNRNKEKNKGEKVEGEAKIVVIGSGVYRIGSSVEFDWASVSAATAIQERGYRTVMINCNPETVSTDYDICDKLYFEELTKERVLDILEKEKPMGVVVSVGGQSSNNLALFLDENDFEIMGTPAASIDRVENRYEFSKILDEIGVNQPRWEEAKNKESVSKFIEKVGFPVILRPSYVLSGTSMRVVHNFEELDRFLEKVKKLSEDHPVVVSEFIREAEEMEIDAVAGKGKLLDYAVSEHVEFAGTHSGDATLIHPPQKTRRSLVEKMVEVSKMIAEKLHITGPFNIQFLKKEGRVWVIECNLRSSRSFPFVSKISGSNLIEKSIRAMLEEDINTNDFEERRKEAVGVKVPRFSLSRLTGADCLKGVEMKSTGEVACMGKSTEEAFLKSMNSIGYDISPEVIFIGLNGDELTASLISKFKRLNEKGVIFYINGENEKIFEKNNLSFARVDDSEKMKKRIDLAIITEAEKNDEKRHYLRRISVNSSIPLITDIRVAELFLESILKLKKEELEIKSWNEY